MPAPETAATLLALPPRRFAAARAAVVKALVDSGDPSADAVRKLRHPTGLAWVMNRLALDRHEDVLALAAAGDRLRDGQRRALAGGGADALRAAEAQLRERARALRLAGGEVIAAEGRPAPAATLARLELLLRAAATSPGPARDALLHGRLAREPEVAAGDLSGFALVPGGARDVRAEAPDHTSRGARPGANRRRATGRTGAAAAEAAREERARARREAAARERARAAAAKALARARAAERRAEAEARTAEEGARRAAASATTAAERARALRARADAAREEAARREAALRDTGGGGR